MSDVAIRVQNLSKQYHIGGTQAGYKTLRESLVEGIQAPFRRARKLLRGQATGAAELDETIWALKDVSFEVNEGEVVGIIGRNGAGKSTLLKVLSRITEPTRGRAEVYGRVGSLLEVGTGFHQELTGRENIYLNGAILGMKKAEIERKFDEIVAFAEIEKFIDTPVKHYSSGMYVRLAFAVAAHLEPEILLVDEVLAVGDVAFQKKCLGKMGDVAKSGRTVLLVSHNMGAIDALCETTVFLEQGKVVDIGQTPVVIQQYLSSLYDIADYSLQNRVDRGGSGRAKINYIYLATSDGLPLQQVLSGQEVMIVIGYESQIPLNHPTFKLTVYNNVGQPLTQFDSSLTNALFIQLPLRGYVGCQLGKLPLSARRYRLHASLDNGVELLDHWTGAYSFTVGPGNYYGTGRNVVGLKDVCLVDQTWQLLENAPEVHWSV